MNVLFQYLTWQFYDRPKTILKEWEDFLLFGLNYFSLPILFKTLFSPWHRYSASYGKRIDFKRFFETLVFNLMSRIIGFIIRSVFVVFGVLMEIFIVLAGIVIFVTWLVLPFVLIIGLVFGLNLLF